MCLDFFCPNLAVDHVGSAVRWHWITRVCQAFLGSAFTDSCIILAEMPLKGSFEVTKWNVYMFVDQSNSALHSPCTVGGEICWMPLLQYGYCSDSIQHYSALKWGFPTVFACKPLKRNSMLLCCITSLICLRQRKCFFLFSHFYLLYVLYFLFKSWCPGCKTHNATRHFISNIPAANAALSLLSQAEIRSSSGGLARSHLSNFHNHIFLTPHPNIFTFLVVFSSSQCWLQ